MEYMDEPYTENAIDYGSAPIAYTWDTVTFELTGSTPCQLDPLEAQLQGKAVWLVPARATLTQPQQIKPGYVNVWNGSAWNLCEDRRGQNYWLPFDRWNDPAKTMSELGALPADALFEPPAKPKEVLDAEIENAVVLALQEHLDTFARTRRYDGIMSACTYATSVLPQFQIEGQYCVEARDNTWAKGYEILNAVLSGERPIPTVEEVLAELPKLQWPEATI